MKLYLAGPMRGIPEFNFPAFHTAAKKLRDEGHIVFNPAERDNEKHGTDISKGNATGDEGQAAKEHGFSLRDALADDLWWICKEAEGIAVLSGWTRSKGAQAEIATAFALGLHLIYLQEGSMETKEVGRGQHLEEYIYKDTGNISIPALRGRKDEPGLRYDNGKLRYDLLPADALAELVKVYTFGAAKYADRNWEKGMSWSRCFGSLLRHAFAYWAGEDNDQETELPHMAHVAWNALALCAYSMRGMEDFDDRPSLRGKIKPEHMEEL